MNRIQIEIHDGESYVAVDRVTRALRESGDIFVDDRRRPRLVRREGDGFAPVSAAWLAERLAERFQFFLTKPDRAGRLVRRAIDAPAWLRARILAFAGDPEWPKRPPPVATQPEGLLPPEPPELKHAFSLYFPWRDRRVGESGGVETKIRAAHPAAHYQRLCKNHDHGLKDGECCSSRSEANWRAFVARSMIAFMDITGLTPSRAFARVFKPEHPGALPPGFDHTRLWRDGGAYVATTEPYNTEADRVVEWCARFGWACERLPVGVGMWNPDGPMGTRLILCAPPRIGAPIAHLAPALAAGMPRWPG